MAIYRNQTREIVHESTQQFHADVLRGLSATPKCISSKYFYDEVGDVLFQQIMDSPDYYLTRCEMEIFTAQAAEIAQTLVPHHEAVDVVELGAGDATKSTHLLHALAANGIEFTYFPIDISSHVIELLTTELPQRIENIKVHGLVGEYLEMVKQANRISERKKVYLFLGANIGNFNVQQAHSFLKELYAEMRVGDILLIGLDLKKNPKQILQAYDDREGITKAFNLNLLTRINKELGGNFNVDAFDHYATYDPLSGACKSFLISLLHQTVGIGEMAIEFEKDEPIDVELSQKYSLNEMDLMATRSGFKIMQRFLDSHNWFVDVVWVK